MTAPGLTSNTCSSSRSSPSSLGRLPLGTEITFSTVPASAGREGLTLYPHSQAGLSSLPLARWVGESEGPNHRSSAGRRGGVNKRSLTRANEEDVVVAVGSCYSVCSNLGEGVPRTHL